MDVNNQDLSLSLYSYLCKVVGSEDVVRTRRRICIAYDHFNRKSASSILTGGSKAEGLDLPGSDFDLMFIDNKITVYENIEDLMNHKQQRKLSHIMDTNDTKPGYTKLKVYSGIDMDFIYAYYKIGHDTFLSSRDLREVNGTKYDDIVIHGPCISDGSWFDVVHSFRCEKWISQADKWIHRARLSWPHDRLIERIVQYGVLFVPIGCKNSSHQDLEFRISFNYAEKILVHSFSHVQLLCYALMKIVLKNFIKPEFGDLLCSYFVKTIMFWVIEESLESTWEPHNLLRCFDLCFKRLVYCVTYSTCLHYFIPELNFFEDRFSKSEHDSLLNTLHSGRQFVFQTPSSATIVHSVCALQTVSYIATFLELRLSTLSLITFIKSVFRSLRFPGKQIFAIVMSYAMQSAAQSISLNETYHVTNKQRYRNYRNCLNNLLQGIHHDAVSGWLVLASFFYTCKQYQQCLHVLNYGLHQCTPDKILLELNIDTELQHEFNIEMQQHAQNGFLRTCKNRVIDYVRFHKTSSIIPVELSVVFDSDLWVFPPVVFAHFLRCICLHRLNRNREKRNASRDLETTVREMYFINNHDNRLKQMSRTLISVAEQLLAD